MKKIFTLLSFYILIAISSVFAQGTSLQNPDNINMQELQAKLQKTKIPWVHNSGQQDKQVAYYANTFAGTVFLTKEGDLVYNLPKEKGKANVVKEVFAGANPKNIQASNKAVAKINHFMKKGDGFTEHHNESFYTVSLGKIWDGIEVKLNAYGSNIEKLFFVEPHTDYRNIKVEVPDATELEVKDSGELHITTPSGKVAFSAPVAYQMIDGEKVDVEVEYLVSGDSYSFAVGEYDPEVLLVVDPLIASTYLGGSSRDDIYDIDIDSENNIFVLGTTWSDDFPITSGTSEETVNSYLVKFSSDLSEIKAATFFDLFKPNNMDINEDREIYVIGAKDKKKANVNHESILKFSNDLTVLLGHYDMPSYAASSQIVVKNNKVFVAGFTTGIIFPTEGAFSNNKYERDNIFIAKLSSNLSTVEAISVFGDQCAYGLKSIQITEANEILVMGKTGDSNFPNKKTIGNSNYYIFLTKLSFDLTELKAGLLIECEKTTPTSMAISKSSNVIITGYTSNTEYPTTANAYLSNFPTNHLSNSEVFITSISSDLSKINYSTFWGGTFNETPTEVLTDSENNIYIVGKISLTKPGQQDYPFLEENSYSPQLKNLFISKFNEELSSLVNVMYFGQKYPINSSIYNSPKVAISPIENIIIGDRGMNDLKNNNLSNKETPNYDDIGIFKISNNLAPNLPIINTPESQNVCVGSNATFTFIIDVFTAVKYQIDIGNGFEDIVDNDTYQGSTTNTLTLKNVAKKKNGYLIRCIANNGISQTISTPVQLNVTAPEINITQQPQNIADCEGNTARFSILADCKIEKYEWYKDNQSINVHEKELILSEIETSNAGTYTCKISNICETEATTSPATLDVLTLEFSENPKGNKACIGSNVYFSANSKSKNITYQWKKDGSQIDRATAITLNIKNIQASDAGNYSCMISNGCAEKESTAATLYIDTPLEITKQPVNTWGCKGSEIIFSAESSGSRPFFLWYKENSPIIGSNSTELKLTGINSADLGKYKITATNTCGTVESEAVELTIPKPKTPTIEGKEKVCFKSEKISYSAEKNKDYTFDWTVYNGIFNSTQENNKILVDWTNGSSKGQIKLKVTDNKTNCRTELNKWVDIDSNLPPKPNILIKGDALLLCTDSGMNAYQWYLDKEAIEGADRQFYEIPEGKNGTYHIKVFFENGCGTASDQITASDKKKLSVKISPNPATEVLTFQMENSYKGNISYSIYHPSGNIIKTGRVKKNEGQFSHSLSLPQVMQGNYLAVFRFDDRQMISKQIIVK